MAEIRINTTGGLKLYDADNSHYAQIVAGTITSNVDAITLGHDTVTIADNLSLGSDSAILKLGADGDATLTHDGTTGLTIAATPISIDSTGELHLNSTTGDIKLQDGGTDQIAFDLDGTAGEVIMKPAVDSDDLVISQYDGTEVIRIEDNASLGLVGNKLSIANSSSDVVIKPLTDAKDIIFQQYDGTEVARIEDNATFNVSSAGKFAYAGTAVTATAAEMNLLDGGTSVGSSITLADADGLVVNDGGTMKTIPASDVKTYTGGANFVRTGNNESNDLGINGFMSSTYFNYVIYASITNTGTDNTFVNMRFRDDSNNVNTSNRNYSFIYTIGDGTTDYDAISQDTASGNTHKISVGDDINETYNYVIHITNHQGNNIFYNYTATTENWTNGSSQSIKGGGKHYSDGTNITGIDFITNAGTSIAGKIACFAIKSS
jgi:hypothetical protein